MTQNSTNATLSTSGTPFVSELPAGVTSLFNAQTQKYPELTVKGPDGKPMTVVAIGYDSKTGAVYFSSSGQGNRYVNNSPARQAERARNPQLNTTAQYIANNGGNTHVLTMPGVQGKNAQQALQHLQAQQGRISLKQMHILAPQQQTDQAQVRSENDKKNFWDKEFLGLSARAWAWIIGGLILGGLCYGAFRKGGWLNKRKNKSTPSSITPTPTGPGQTPTEPGQTPTGPTPTIPTPTLPVFTDTPIAGTTPATTIPATTPAPTIGTNITNGVVTPGYINTNDYGGNNRR